MIERYFDGIINWHKIVVPVVVIAMMFLAAGAPKLEVDHDIRSFLNPGNPILQSYDEFQDVYGSDDSYFIIIVPAGADVFEAETLELIRDVGLAARDIPYYSSVSSMMESPHFPMPLAIAALNDRTAMQAFRAAILDNPMIAGRLVGPGGQAAAVKINVSLPEHDAQARSTTVVAARSIVREISREYPEAAITLAGNIAVTEGMSEAISENIYKVGASTLLIICLLLLLISRNIYSTAAIAFVMLLSVSATMGAIGWLGFKLTVVAGFVPAAVATLAVADAVHLLVGYHAALRDGNDKKSALRVTLRSNAKAIFITSLTSVAGVLMLNFSDAPPYRAMGNMIACGIVVAYIVTMTLWPALMAWFPVPRKTPRLLDITSLQPLGLWVMRHRPALLIILGTISVLIVAQASRNSLTERWHEYLGTEYEARIAIEAVTQHFGGIHHVYYSLDSGRAEGVFDLDYIAQVAAFTSWYENQDGVNHAVGIADAFRIAGFLSGGQEGEPLRVQPLALIRATLVAGGISLNESEGTALVNSDYSSSIFEVIYKPLDSAGLMEADRLAIEWLAENAPNINASTGLGLDLVFAQINVANVRSMLLGATLAMLMVSILLMLLLRSLKLGLISLIPNLIPIGLAFGVWGMMVGQINMAVSVVMGISLGLVVDDTVHFLCKYMAAKDDVANNSMEAVTSAFARVGTAILVSSLVLMVGFSGALVADITPTRQTAILLITTIGFAMLADLFLLPPLIALLDKKPPVSRMIGSGKQF